MHNRLLAALPPDEYQRLLPQLELVPLTLGQVVYAPGEAPEYVYFPVDSVIALLYGLDDGGGAEISLVGNEGMAGVAMSFGGASTLTHALVQAPGRAYRLHGQALRHELNGDGELQRVLFGYSRALLAQMAQTASCNLHHPLHQRLCRWLLLTLDRLPSNRLVLEQSVIASILGVPPAQVDAAAAKLQRLGAISYGRDQISVHNRAQLERLCCECYALVRVESDRLASSAQFQHKLRSLV